MHGNSNIRKTFIFMFALSEGRAGEVHGPYNRTLQQSDVFYSHTKKKCQYLLLTINRGQVRECKMPRG